MGESPGITCALWSDRRLWNSSLVLGVGMKLSREEDHTHYQALSCDLSGWPLRLGNRGGKTQDFSWPSKSTGLHSHGNTRLLSKIYHPDEEQNEWDKIWEFENLCYLKVHFVTMGICKGMKSHREWLHNMNLCNQKKTKMQFDINRSLKTDSKL